MFEPNKEIQLWHGDCLELLKHIPDQSIDLVLTDPPYGTTACKWDSVIAFEPMWAELKRVIKPSSAILLFGSEPYSSLLRVSNLKMYKYDWVWEKNKGSGHLNAKIMPMKYHELIHVFGLGKINYFPIETAGHKPMNYAVNKQNNINGKHDGVVTDSKKTTRKPKSVLKFNMVNNDGSMDGGKFHPTQKPVDLLEYLIKTYTQDGEMVLDFTMGSASTGVACFNTGRRFIGIEKDEHYFQVAKDRLAAIHAPTG